MTSPFEGTSVETREYQNRICAKTIDMLDGKWVAKDGSNPGPARSVLIDSPTGSGKTVMGLGIAAHAARLGKRVGWVAMRRNLLTQAGDTRDRFGFDVPNMRMISMFDKDPPTDVDWLVVDEAQHDATYSMAHLHDRIRPEKVIGLSATPYRSDRAQLAFERVVRDAGINSLIQEGWLSRYDHYTIRNFTPRSVSDLFVEHPGRWGKSVVFFRTMQDCEETSRLLGAAGVRNEVVWGGSDREAQIDAFRTGEVPVLVSMSILAEGFDVDDMKTVFVRPSGRPCSIQMGGRVLRRHSDITLKQIVQCQDTHHPFVKTAVPHNSFVLHDGQWRALKATEDVEAVAAEWTAKILHSTSGLPKFLKNRKRSSRDAIHQSGNSDESNVSEE